MTALNESQAREEICRVGRSLFERGYVHATAGNISVRLDDGFLITPTDACLGFLDPARLAKLDQLCPGDFAAVKRQVDILACRFSAEEFLAQLEADGLVELEPGWINVTARGRLLIRNVCMVFDRYLGSGTGGPRHSRTI